MAGGQYDGAAPFGRRGSANLCDTTAHPPPETPAVLALLFAAAAIAAAGPGHMDRAVDVAVSQGFAGEVLVTDTKAVTYARVVSAPGRPHSRGELWRWASVTKQLTATLILQQVAAGKLGLDDTLAKRLPDFKGAGAAQVTIRMLLQHTSGLPNPDDTPSAGGESTFPTFYLRSSRGVGGPADAYGYCAGTPKAAPGAGFSYNNCDFIVLGAVLEHLTGQSFSRLLETQITRPLGLRSLRMARSDGPAPRTVPATLQNGAPEPPFVLATFGPAGAAYGSSDDLVRFHQALLSGRLLTPAVSRAAWTGDSKLGYVALGVWSFSAPLMGCAEVVELVERRGEIGGVEVRNLLAPKRGRALIVFADRAGLEFGEIWQGKGLTYEIASAAFCG